MVDEAVLVVRRTTMRTHLPLSRFGRFASTLVLGLSLLTASSFADAGTYSVVSIEWYPSNTPGTATDGGYIHFGSTNSLDLEYGMSSGVGAPTNQGNSATASPSVNGTFRWKIQWVGNPGDAHPDSVLANVEYKGSGHTGANGTRYATIGGDAQGRASINDPYFSCGSLANSGAQTVTVSDPEDSTGNGVHNVPQGAGTFALVQGTTNTYIGYVLMTVNDNASLSASGDCRQTRGAEPLIYTAGGASVSLSVTMRLTTVAGQRVQPDL